MNTVHMIPKILHYCWFGNNPRPYLMHLCIESWKKFMPGYEIKEWNESNSPLDSAYCKAAIAGGLWSKVSNYVRLRAVLDEGGIYMDTDFEVVRSLDPLRVYECFLGFQKDREDQGWVTNGIIGAASGHSFLQKCIDRTIEIFEKTGEFELSPRMTSIVLKEMGLTSYRLQTLSGVTIFPREYFYPYSWKESYSPACITENTYAVHHWAGSWR